MPVKLFKPFSALCLTFFPLSVLLCICRKPSLNVSQLSQTRFQAGVYTADFLWPIFLVQWKQSGFHCQDPALCLLMEASNIIALPFIHQIVLLNSQSSPCHFIIHYLYLWLCSSFGSDTDIYSIWESGSFPLFLSLFFSHSGVSYHLHQNKFSQRVKAFKRQF